MLLTLRWLLLSCWFVAASAWAGPIQFQAGGLLGAGPSVTFALDFVDGAASVTNQVVAANFSSNGSSLTEGTRQGDVSGNLTSGLTLRDTSFLTEVLINLVGASNFGFVFNPTTIAPALGEFGDSFSVFLLGAGGVSLIETDDPTGNNALFVYTIDGSGSGQLSTHSELSGLGMSWSLTPQNPGTVPEPSALALVVVALLLAGLVRTASAARARALWFSLLALSGALGTAQAEDLTASVQITRSGLVLNRSIGTFDAQITVTNRSADTLLGPLQLVLESATPANVALYNSYGRSDGGADYVVLPLPTGTLAPGATASVPVRLLSYGQGIGSTVFKLHGRRLLPASSAQIVVSAVYAAGVMGPSETAVGAGWEVAVDGVVRGVTGANGRLTVAVPTDSKVVSVSRAPSEAGSAVLPALAGGSTTPLKVTVDEGKEVNFGSLVRLEQAQQGVLARNLPAVTLRFFKDEKAVKLAGLDNVNLIDTLGNYSNLTALFALQADGSVISSGAAFMQALAGKTGRLMLEVGGSDTLGNVHVATVPFHLADYRVRVQLVAPPSNPALALVGVRVTASLLNSDIRFVAQSDANGYIVLPDLPAGNLSFSGGANAGGITYGASGSVAVNRNTLVRLTLRGPADVLANVPPISSEPLQSNALRTGASAVAVATERSFFTASQAAERALLQSHARPLTRSTALLAQANPTSVNVQAVAGAQDAIVQDTAQLTVKKGTKKVTLKYTVFTVEYPTYVLAQSVYNDVWSLSVLAGTGASMFDITRQINSQLTQEPVWRADGSTGELKQEINVEALAAAADTTLILRATSVNIGDSALETIVNATLDSTEPLLIGTITPDANPATANDGSYYSIPRPAGRNVLHRTFDVELTKPSGSTLTAVTLELRDGAGSVLQTALQDVAPGGAGVSVVTQNDTSAKLRVRATIDNPASTIASQPPPTRNLTYHFIVKGTSAEGLELKDEKDASGKRALWRMPDGIGRYGGRDDGFDDWAARGTYNWLAANSGLIREINDISGEHGRNIGHATHGRGTDIDTYHFYRFPGAVSGGQNYDLLRADVVAAFGTLQNPAPPAATTAFNRVAAWITATRNGLTSLANLNTVSQLIYCQGVAANGLPAGWCSGLIRTGSVTRTVAGPNGPVNQTLNFGGNFANAKVVYRNDHNDHLHVTLNAALIDQ